MKKIAILLTLALLCLACKHGKGGNDSTPPVEKPPVRSENAAKIAVLHQVNGEYVKGLKIGVYESGSSQAVFEDVAKFGYVYPKLEVGRKYDIKVMGNDGYASSVIKNLQIKAEKQDIAVIALPKVQKTRDAAFLELLEFKYKDGSDEKVITDGLNLNTPLGGKFIAKVASASGAMYNSLSYGFSARLAVGMTPYSFAGLLTTGSINGEIQGYPEYRGEKWTNDFVFDCVGGYSGNMTSGIWESFSNEEQDVVAVFYDATGNRLEVHNYLVLKPNKQEFTKYEGDDIKVKDFHVNSLTYSSYNQMYSISPENSGLFESSTPKSDAHCAVNVHFMLSETGGTPHSHPRMLGAEVFRREAGEGEFEKVVTRVYKKQDYVRESNTYLGSYVLDNTGALEIGKEYEYKARIYIPSGHYLDTGVAKVKILPQCKVYLHSPAHNASLDIEGAHASFDNTLKQFQVKVSEGGLWDAKNSDYFTLGLVIRQFNDTEMYKMLLRYHFDYKNSGKPEIEFVSKQNGTLIVATSEELKTLGYLPYYVNVDSLVEFDRSTSIVTLKKDLFEARVFNVSARWDTFKDGEIYYWDVFGAKEDLADAVSPRSQTRVPPSFTKEYVGEDGNIGYSRTFCAGLSLGSISSENGRFAFTVRSKTASTSSVSSYEKPSKQNIIEGSYIVNADESFEDKVKALGAKIYGKIEAKGGLSWYCVRYDEKDKDILNSLLNIDGVVSADYEHIMMLPKNEMVKPSTSSAISALALNDKVTLGSGYSLAITKALDAYEEFDFGRQKVLCGIVDSGVFRDHEDLQDAQGNSIIKDYFVQDIEQTADGLRFAGWKKALSGDGDPAGHGSHCVGIMAAVGNNEKGITGVSWKNTEVVAYRGLEDPISKGFQEFASCDAIRQFTNYIKERKADGTLKQACVPLNLSFGTTAPSPLMFEVIEDALENGILPVVAMANDGVQIASYPASYAGVLAVGSSNGGDNISSYSNKGAWISVVAPGENIMSLNAHDSSGYVNFNGTSMAAPFVTGMATYLAGLNRELTPYQIKEIIEKTADKILGNEDFNTERGYGRVNVYKAAKLAIETTGGEQGRYSSHALKVKVNPKLREADGGAEFSFGNNVPYVFLYDERGICVAGGYVVAVDPLGQPKENMNIAIFRGLPRGKYLCKIHSYVYKDWPKVYRLVDAREVDFAGDGDELVEFTDYALVKNN